MSATGNEVVTLSQFKTAFDSLGGAGGGGIEILNTDTLSLESGCYLNAVKINGVVILNVMCSKKSMSLYNNINVCQLPVGWRPSSNQSFASGNLIGWNNTNSQYTSINFYLDIDTGGSIQINRGMYSGSANNLTGGSTTVFYMT